MTGLLGMIFALVIAVGLGLVVQMLLWPVPRHCFERAIWAALSVGLGLGISSLTYFLWLVLPVTSPLGLLAIELSTIAVGVIVLILRSRRQAQTSTVEDEGRTGPVYDGAWLIAPVLGAISLTSVWAFWLVQREQPHGAWDAFAMFNARARFFFRGAETWTDAYHISDLFHPDYPAMLPSAVARLWTYADSEIVLAPALVGFCFVVSTVVLLFGLLAARRSVVAAVLATTLVCGLRTVQYGNDSFVLLGALQLADVPLAFFLLAALGLALPGFENRKGCLVVSGLSISLAAWSKNEGILALLVFLVSLAVLEFRDRDWRDSARRVGCAVLGATPVAGLLIAYKLFLAPANDIISSSNVGIVDRLLDPGRYIEILSKLLLSLGQYGGGAMLVFGVMILFLGLRNRSEMLGHILPLLVVLGLLAGYSAIYVITPHDLTWHQNSSQLRLLTQLWPSMLLGGFLMVRDPTLAFARIVRDSDPALGESTASQD